MSGAANNPYKQEAPDKTLTQEGVAADAKAVGDALSKKTNKIQIASKSFSGTTDTYAQVSIPIPDNSIAILFVASSNTLFIPAVMYTKSVVFRCITGLTSAKLDFAKNAAVSGTLYYLTEST